MKKKSLLKKYFWRFILLLAIIFILWQRYPIFFKDSFNSIVSSINVNQSSNLKVKWKKLNYGIETCTLSWKNNEATFATSVFMLRFDPDLIQTRVLYQHGLTTVKKIAESEGAFAAINASFFDPDGRPLGLLVQNSRVTQRMPQRGMLSSGIFCLKYNRPQIFHRSKISMSGVTEAIQSFPRLIHNGRRIQQIRNKHEAKRRSGIAIDYKGNIIIYTTDTHFSGLSLSDLQDLLLKPQLNIRSALNLDGGRSSQLYLNYQNSVKHIIGLSDVPVFLGFFEK